MVVARRGGETGGIAHSHKDSGLMGSRDGIEEQDTILVRGFYKAGTKMTPHFQNGIVVSESRNDTLDLDFYDYGIAVVQRSNARARCTPFLDLGAHAVPHPPGCGRECRR